MNQFFRTLSRRAFCVLSSLSLAAMLLAGCSAAPDGEEESPSEATTTGTYPVPTADKPTLAPQPLDALLTGADFTVLFVNVGKADAAILRFGDTTVLIDTGSAQSVPQLIAGLNALNVTNIGAVFITHSHSDHIGGIDALAANYDIPIVYSPYYSEQGKDGDGKIVKRLEKLGLRHAELQAGDTVSVADGVSFTVLGPLRLNEQDDNDNSLVLRFSFGGSTFLFAGDMQFAEEQDIAASGADLAADVLKVGNHGNPDATGEDFAALVSPCIAVISTDTAADTDSANPRVLAALSMAGVYITQDFPLGVLLAPDASGALAVSSPAQDAALPDVIVSGIDTKQQTVTLVNSGASPADLSGCVLFSVRSDATLRFPEGTILSAGETLTIGKGEAFAFPNENKPLDKKKDNTILFYARLGMPVSEYSE